MAKSPAGELGGHGLEQFLWQMNLTFTARLDAAGIDHTDDFHPGGSHSWPYWQDELHWALPQLLQIIG